MLARATLPSNTSRKALMVSKDALVLNGGLKMIWTIDAKSIESKGDVFEGNAIPVVIETAIEEGNLIQVRSEELKPGIEVVIRGNERITPSRPGQPPSRVTWTKKPTNQQK
jgi:hypothetical protein